MIRRAGVLVVSFALLAAGSVHAQSMGAFEMGLDGGVSVLSFDGSNNSLVTVSFPVPILRVGYFLTDRLEIEPSAGIQRIESRYEPEVSSDVQVSQSGRGQLGLAYHLGESGGSRFFLKASGLVLFAGTDKPDTQSGVEGSLGWKARLASHWAARLELSVARLFERGTSGAAWMPSLTVGFTHFSR